MNIISSIKRLTQSLKTETDPDILLTSRAILTGMVNYFKSTKADYITENAYICKSCPDNIPETDPDMKVRDKQFEFLTDRMCGACGGCSLAFKVRQNVKPCDKWQKH